MRYPQKVKIFYSIERCRLKKHTTCPRKKNIPTIPQQVFMPYLSLSIPKMSKGFDAGWYLIGRVTVTPIILMYYNIPEIIN